MHDEIWNSLQESIAVKDMNINHVKNTLNFIVRNINNEIIKMDSFGKGTGYVCSIAKEVEALSDKEARDALCAYIQNPSLMNTTVVRCVFPPDYPDNNMRKFIETLQDEPSLFKGESIKIW